MVAPMRHTFKPPRFREVRHLARVPVLSTAWHGYEHLGPAFRTYTGVVLRAFPFEGCGESGPVARHLRAAQLGALPSADLRALAPADLPCAKGKKIKTAEGALPSAAMTFEIACRLERSRSKRYPAQHLVPSGLAHRDKTFFRSHARIGVIHPVEHHNQLVGIGARVAISADRRSNGPDCGITICNRVGDIPQAIRRSSPR